MVTCVLDALLLKFLLGERERESGFGVRWSASHSMLAILLGVFVFLWLVVGMSVEISFLCLSLTEFFVFM